jgi:hypothetical protein
MSGRDVAMVILWAIALSLFVAIAFFTAGAARRPLSLGCVCARATFAEATMCVDRSVPIDPAKVVPPLNLCPVPERTTEWVRVLAESMIRANAAIVADLADMAEGDYTGRHCQAFLDGKRS